MFKTLFGVGGPKVDLREKIAQGATIVDVRTPDEFRSGHVAGAVNIPLDRIQSEMKRIAKDKPVITCCRSGARSGIAADILKAQGFDVYNGGSWTSVNNLK
jgi:phage shock protein E